MHLPNGDQADLGAKLEDYCLNLSHRQGQHKALLAVAQRGGDERLWRDVPRPLYFSGMFHSLGLFAYRRRYLVIAAWTVVLCVSVPLLPRLHSVLHGGGFANGTSEADRALALLQGDLRYYPSAVTIIFSDKRLHVGEPAFNNDIQVKGIFRWAMTNATWS